MQNPIFLPIAENTKFWDINYKTDPHAETICDMNTLSLSFEINSVLFQRADDGTIDQAFKN